MSKTVHIVGDVCPKRSTQNALFFTDENGEFEGFIPRSQIHSSVSNASDLQTQLWISAWLYEKKYGNRSSKEVKLCPHCKKAIE